MKQKIKILEFWLIFIFVIVINFIFPQILFAESKLILDIQRSRGTFPTVFKINDWQSIASNPFSADSGTGNTHSSVLKLKMTSDSIHFDSLEIKSDISFLQFKSIKKINNLNPIPNFVNSAVLYDITPATIFDLELQFAPWNTMHPGYYEGNLLIKAKEINDSGKINLLIPLRLLHNPEEWYDVEKKPGIELFLISSIHDTTNLIFGSGYKSTILDDTLYGEMKSMHGLRNAEARFVIDNQMMIPYGLWDISPNDEQSYSNSRDIKTITDDSIPLIYHVVFEFKDTTYPIMIEYETYNFNPEGTYIVKESLGTNNKFSFDMRNVNKLSNGRYQYNIFDTSVKNFYIIYTKNTSDIMLENLSEYFIIDKLSNNNIYLNNSFWTNDIEIFNIFGIKILETKYNETINIASFINGIYFIKSGNRIEKFIKLN